MSTLRMVRQDNASLTVGDMAESSHEPGLTVVIPCLNERITIAEAVMQARAAFANWPEGKESRVRSLRLTWMGWSWRGLDHASLW